MYASPETVYSFTPAQRDFVSRWAIYHAFKPSELSATERIIFDELLAMGNVLWVNNATIGSYTVEHYADEAAEKMRPTASERKGGQNVARIAAEGWNTLAQLEPNKKPARKKTRREYAQHAINSGLWAPGRNAEREAALKYFDGVRWFRRCFGSNQSKRNADTRLDFKTKHANTIAKTRETQMCKNIIPTVMQS